MKYIYMTMMAVLIFSAAIAKTTKADRLFEQWEYFRAAKLYEKEASKRPNADVYFKLGECYRKMNLYKEEQAAYDKVDAAGVYSKPEFYLNYGQVLKSNGNYSKAKIAFDKYSELMPNDPRGKFFSESIDIIAEDHKTDEPISVNNIPSVNTADADLIPAVYKDGIVFTSSRKTPGHNKKNGWTGSNYLDLYYGKKDGNDSTFSEVARFGDAHINSKYHNAFACYSKNFDTMYISKVEKYLDAKEKKTMNIERNKIFMSTMKEDKWTKEVPFAFNSDSFSVAQPFLSPDGSKIYFASDMPGGFGESDIYYCNREGSGWSKPVNMGPSINTFNREKFPKMDAAGNFYFSSDGYQGFGGSDICVALNKNGAFEKAVPMKYPFNSNGDDYGITFLNDRKTGYISSNRSEGGKGNDDIFYFSMLNKGVDSTLETYLYTIGYKRKPLEQIVAVTTTILKGTITDYDTKRPLGAKINIVDNNLGKSVATIEADNATGNYSTPLAPGKNYGLAVKMNGYLFHSENFDIAVVNHNQVITKDVELQKVAAGKTIVLKNVFFDYNEAILKPQSSFELDHVIQILEEHPGMKIELSGHTDSRGTEKFNKKLSDARAKACLNYLIARGIKINRLKSHGYGEMKPIDTNDTETGMAHNRRTEFSIIQ
jgi:outer membrane protein OmpA-like peptidoglycan-associated protein/tetratricopeptide (TPR) repeat protein